MVGVVRDQSLNPLNRGKQGLVARRDLCAKLEDPVEFLELGDPDRGRKLVEPVVVTEAGMREPLARVHSSSVWTATAPPSPVVVCLFG